MKIEDFTIGTEFQTSTGQRWRCTDVGGRTILAIELDPDLHEAWFAGPPYAIPEEAFDEIEIRRAFRTIEEATRSALETVHKGTHPGYPSDVVAIMMKTRAASVSRRYPRSGLFQRTESQITLLCTRIFFKLCMVFTRMSAVPLVAHGIDGDTGLPGKLSDLHIGSAVGEHG